MLTSNIREPVFVPVTPLRIQLPASAPEKAVGDDPGAWVPDAHMDNPDGVTGSWHETFEE